MPPPDLQSPTDFALDVMRHGQRIPYEWREKYLKRELDKLPQDVTILFDRAWQLEREKDRLREALGETQRKLDAAEIKIWVLGLIQAGAVSVVAWLIHEFLKP